MRANCARSSAGKRRALLALVAVFLPLTAQAAAEEEDGLLTWRWARSDAFCDGNCAVTIYAGKFLKTEMVQVFGTTDEFIPFWDWTYDGSWMVSGAFTRRVGGFGELIAIEAEAGLAKRLGATTELEIWTALYFRWKWFPWNDYLRTTIGVSTGFNWASGIPEEERIRAIDGTGRKFLHYFSPEFTLGLPSQPDWDLHVRIHHRSGWWVFPDIGGGAQFLNVGIRKYF